MTYKGYINDIKNIIKEITKSEKNICITGKNMSGKSDILLKFLEENSEKVYFIDTVNRIIFDDRALSDFSDRDDAEEKIGTPQEIIKRRIREEYFNKIDTYGGGEKNIGGAYSFKLFKLLMHYNDFQKEFKTFISDFDVNINLENRNVICRINEEEVIMSSGFQALVRIFIEIFIYDAYNNEKSLKYIVIDEIDQHLDNTMCRIIMRKINELFPNIRIITTVHSLTFFEELENTKIISLDGKNYSYKILDPRDLGGLEYIDREVFNSYIDKSTGITRMNEIYMKVFNDIELSEEDKMYLTKDTDLSPDEKNMKAIILAEVDMEW